jgi:hypothetical protein
MAIVVNSTEKNNILWWQAALIAISVILFLLLAGDYFYTIFTEKKIRKELEKSPQEIALENDIKQKENDLDIKSKKISSFKEIFSSHKNINNIFDFIEKNCLPDVWFSKFNFGSGKGQIEVLLSGEAENFVSIGQQMIIFKESSVIGSSSLESLKIGEKGGASFGIRLIFNSEILSPLHGS